MKNRRLKITVVLHNDGLFLIFNFLHLFSSSEVITTSRFTSKIFLNVFVQYEPKGTLRSSSTFPFFSITSVQQNFSLFNLVP